MKPQKLTAELAKDAQLLITMGCGDKCPYVPGLRRDNWPLRDPKGLPTEEVRAIRDEIMSCVQGLLKREGIRCHRSYLNLRFVTEYVSVHHLGWFGDRHLGRYRHFGRYRTRHSLRVSWDSGIHRVKTEQPASACSAVVRQISALSFRRRASCSSSVASKAATRACGRSSASSALALTCSRPVASVPRALTSIRFPESRCARLRSCAHGPESRSSCLSQAPAGGFAVADGGSKIANVQFLIAKRFSRL